MKNDPSLNAIAFPHAGLYVMRSPRMYLLAACQQIGVKGHGPHKHNDWLSFELFVDDQPLVIDPGTFCYTGDLGSRRLFRSTAYHNTVVIDREEQVPIHNCEFSLTNGSGDVRVVRSEFGPEQDVLKAEHTGYSRLRAPVVHRRMFLLDKVQNSVEITDSFTGQGKHLLEWYIHLNVGLACHVEGREAVIYKSTKPVGRIKLWGSIDTCQVRPGWVSKRYNHREPSQILYFNSPENPLDSAFKMHFLPIAGVGYYC